jgi:hypothetical protein
MITDQRELLIFTHYGNADYLAYTLRQGTRSNPEMRRILIGDEKNRATAIAAGWEHYLLRDLTSKKRDEFNARFRWVQGPKHQPIKGGQDWLRFVFERFYCVATFLSTTGASHFWHFDSDTMILHPLRRYTDEILRQAVACTTLCNDYCPSGLITSPFLDGYCDSMIRFFQDENYLDAKQSIYDSQRPGDAFTEMPAFCDYRTLTGFKTFHLSSAFSSEGVWFDDCICQSDTFVTLPKMGDRRSIKALRSRTGAIVCDRQGKEMEFATVNCSWVPIDVFRWIELAAEKRLPPAMDSLSSFIEVPLGQRLLGNCLKVLKRGR